MPHLEFRGKHHEDFPVIQFLSGPDSQDNSMALMVLYVCLQTPYAARYIVALAITNFKAEVALDSIIWKVNRLPMLLLPFFFGSTVSINLDNWIARFLMARLSVPLDIQP